MSLSNTLARADADLAAGRVPLARQRLRGLVSSFPCEPAPRRRLAGVYRLYGDPAEAGRWTYLEEDRDTAETAAFEERYGSAARRMKALAWRGPEALAATSFARDRLAEVREACSAEVGRPVGWDEPVPVDGEDTEPEGGGGSVSGVLAGIGCLLCVLATVYIWILGVVSLFD
ncbi:DUF6584 family protein [Streptomyces sp. NPDC093249]|uniref:DUF6584 family protein n=1 Tax=unclassified Streptomyces TaxID=2593676 RepID=UPI00344C5BFD